MFALRDPFFVTFCVAIPILTLIGVLIHCFCCGSRRCRCCCSGCTSTSTSNEAPRDIALEPMQPGSQEYRPRIVSSGDGEDGERSPGVENSAGDDERTRLSCACIWWYRGCRKRVPFTTLQQSRNNSLKTTDDSADLITDQHSTDSRQAEEIL